jgi:transcriptional regulator with XRE-family HTH domain
MVDAKDMTRIRSQLAISQERMARLLGVSFASVNRWEAGHSAPTGSVLDLYEALRAALRAGYSSDSINRAANNERGVFLYTLFRMAHGPVRKRA